MQKLFQARLTQRALALGVLAGATGAANAAVDVTAITASATDVAAVGVAVFAVIVGTKLYKWIRRAL